MEKTVCTPDFLSIALDPAKPDCPRNCPFLENRSFSKDTFALYCSQFETYLIPAKPIALRCDECLGIHRTIKDKGIAYIQSVHDNRHLKSFQALIKSFDSMKKTEQKMFVDLVEKTGFLNLFSSGNALDNALMAIKQYNEESNTPAYKKFKSTLGKRAPDCPDLLTKQTHNLLLNLFKVLDSSERQIMENIFQSPGRANAFLEQFTHQPHDNDLLKNTRAILYEMENQTPEKTIDDDRRRRAQQVLNIRNNSGREL